MKRMVLILITLMPFLFECKAQDTVQYMHPRYLFNTRQYFSSLGVYELLGFDWNDFCCSRGNMLSDNMMRYTITDSIWVFGISVTMDTVPKDIEKYNFHLMLAYMADDSSMVFIDSASWKPSDHRAFFTYSLVGGDGVYYEKTVPAFEIYFETPHLLTDTFYIGLRRIIDDVNPYGDNIPFYYSYDSSSTIGLINAAQYPTTYYQSTSSITYTLRDIWGGLFPIIQPNRHCDVPDRPWGIVYTTTNTVQFELPYSQGDSMTLSIARVGQSPDSGDFYNVTDSAMSVVLPDSGHYEARLRRYCARYGDYFASSWSAAFPILITTPLGIAGPADGIALTINPNPATGKVEVDCNVADGTLTLLDMQGRTLSEMPSSQRVIDVSGLAAGTYMLRLTAPDIAPAVRKLIVAQP